MMALNIRCRATSRRLTWLKPLQGETAPLLFPIGGRSIPMTRGAAVRLRQRGAEFAVTAMRLEQASAHWLRHTAGSHMANNAVDLRHVRDNLGHESLSTTSGYLHSSDDLRQFRCKRSDSRPGVTNVSSTCMSRAFHPVCEVCAESVTPVSFFMHTKGTRK
jgi:integrase